ncbi:MAG: glutaredoxin 3 [Gammaproteobacteria bacterium]|nr:glutaredoxin 3 [Gammaproteobacteria bacterium]
MKKVEVYSHPGCNFCQQAKALLRARGIEFRELDIAQDRQLMSEMVSRTGGRTLPQIVINDRAIGGFDALIELDRNNDLISLLNQQ